MEVRVSISLSYANVPPTCLFVKDEIVIAIHFEPKPRPIGNYPLEPIGKIRSAAYIIPKLRFELNQGKSGKSSPKGGGKGGVPPSTSRSGGPSSKDDGIGSSGGGVSGSIGGAGGATGAGGVVESKGSGARGSTGAGGVVESKGSGARGSVAGTVPGSEPKMAFKSIGAGAGAGVEESSGKETFEESKGVGDGSMEAGVVESFGVPKSGEDGSGDVIEAGSSGANGIRGSGKVGSVGVEGSVTGDNSGDEEPKPDDSSAGGSEVTGARGVPGTLVTEGVPGVTGGETGAATGAPASKRDPSERQVISSFWRIPSV